MKKPKSTFDKIMQNPKRAKAFEKKYQEFLVVEHLYEYLGAVLSGKDCEGIVTLSKKAIKSVQNKLKLITE